ncbi:UDP-N-acetylglucosamine 4,6-dehydratase (inverting) [Magnetococcales bacterium HHB-1]
MRTFKQPLPDLNDKSVMVTGGTGSFGRAFCRMVCDTFDLRRLVIYSRDELKQYEMQQQFPEDTYPYLRFFIGDVRDRERLQMAMNRIDYVIHAAALKQVPTAEYNPFECIHTNVSGAENIVKAAINAQVKRVVALSTDKAVNPVNLYGASKLASDKSFVAANALSGGGTRFSVVRYGNVVGSRGSVVPLFRRLIDEGVTELPITDTRMTRFWITLEQGVNFVLSSLQMMQGGEIFVPKIPSMTMTDLARAMAPDLEHKIIGIRPGEKLHEQMIALEDARHTVELGDRYIIEPAFEFWRHVGYHHDGQTKNVAEDFCYASNTNAETLSAQELMDMI